MSRIAAIDRLVLLQFFEREPDLPTTLAFAVLVILFLQPTD